MRGNQGIPQTVEMSKVGIPAKVVVAVRPHRRGVEVRIEEEIRGVRKSSWEGKEEFSNLERIHFPGLPSQTFPFRSGVHEPSQIISMDIRGALTAWTALTTFHDWCKHGNLDSVEG